MGSFDDSLAEGRRWLDRLDRESESGSSLGEPGQVCPTLVAANDVQLEAAALVATEGIRYVERRCLVRVHARDASSITRVRSLRG